MYRFLRAGLLLALFLALLAGRLFSPGAAPLSAAPPAAGPAAAAASADCVPTGHLLTAPTVNVETLNSSTMLSAVAVAGPGDVWAVGNDTGYDPTQHYAGSALIVHWNGTTWQRVAAPSGRSGAYRFAGLLGLAVISPRDIWAVGTVYNDADRTYRPLVERWDGTSWVLVPAPPPAAGSALGTVAASGPDDVWTIAGSQSLSNTPFHWDGHTWQGRPVPIPPGTSLAPVGLVVRAPNDAWIAGTLTDGEGPRTIGGLLAHWDGQAWQVQRIDANLMPPDTSLTTIAAAGPRDIWLAGNRVLPTGPVPTAVATLPPGGTSASPTPSYGTGPVALRWDGSQWSRTLIPDNYFLRALTFVRADDGWAAGAASSNGGHYGLLHWDGMHWTPTAIGDPPWNPQVLTGLAAEGADDIWAVGFGDITGSHPIELDRLSIGHIFRDCAVPTAPAPDPQDPAVTYFPATGHTLRGLMRTYWQDHGGLAQFGYPLTDEFSELSATDGRIYTVQYFERNRFELHPENAGSPFTVLVGLLGRLTATGAQQQYPYAGAFQPLRQGPPGTRFFPATGHSLAPAFRAYWEERGGLAVYGYPISEPFQEISPTDGKSYLVQYFERNRLELHPELPAEFRVSLGLLGVDVLRSRGWLR